MSMTDLQDALSATNENPTPYSRPHTPKLFPTQIGFIGLGNIGFLMARNLAMNAPRNDVHKSLPPLLVWNRTVTKAQKLIGIVGEEKARLAKDPEQIARECDIVFVNLANDDVVRMIYYRLAASLKVCLLSVAPSLHTKLSAG